MNSLQNRITAMTPEQKRSLREHLIRVRPAQEIPVQPRDGRDFPLSHSQDRLWFLDQLVPGNPFYNISIAQRLPFVPLQRYLEKALSAVVARHEALRTVFPLVRGQPVQRILPATTMRCEIDDLSCEPDPEARAAQIASAASQQPFDLAEGPLLHCRLLELSAGESLLLLVIHHIVADGWSLEKLLAEIGQVYSELLTGRLPSLPPLPVQYADFAVWQREAMSGERMAQHRKYWVQRLEGMQQLELPTDHPRPARPSYRGARAPITIDAAAAAAAEALARRLHTTRFTVLFAAFAALLHRLAGQDDVTIGTPMAARPYSELEDVVGFFANTVVLRLDFSGGCSFEEAVERTHARLREAQNHQDLPFSMVVAALAPEQDLSRNPLFQVSFQVLTSSQVRRTITDAAPAFNFARGTSAFDLTLQLAETASCLVGELEYATDLFQQASAERLVERFLRLLCAALADPEASVADLPLMDAAELRQLEAWSRGPVMPSAETDLCGLFEAQARLSPDAVACQAPDGRLSYAELDGGANSLAHQLIAHGVEPGDCVGVAVEPCTYLPMALLAVLKAGAAYVPLGRELPVQRARDMLADAGATVLLVCKGTESDLQTGFTSIAVDREPPQPGVPCPKVRRDAESPAYILFTSGSTGRPKGVSVPHRALLNYLRWCMSVYPVNDGEGAPLCTSITADMSVTTLFVPLLSGKTVFLLPAGGGLEALEEALHSGRRYSFVKLTPSHLEGLRQLAAGRAPACATGCFIVGGEALHGETLEPWRTHMPGLLIVNEYGPTETTVGCCAHFLRAGDIRPGPVPIGRPIALTRLNVCNRSGAPVPVGVVGELRIGGAGVALGYVGQAGLTAERFVRGPDGALVYRSGDRVRHRRDGTLEYLGRADNQIKLRGHRVEPDEVEAALRTHPAVAEAAVVLHRAGPGDDRLHAALLLSPGCDLDQADLTGTFRSHLQDKLPPFMIPSAFKIVEEIPLTANGKADRDRIARMLAGAAPRQRPHATPQTALETLLVRCFCDVLKVPEAGATDDFFADLGGHSLLATRLVSQLRELLQIEIPLRRVFEARCARELARAIAPDDSARQRLEAAAAIVLQVLEMSDADVRQQLLEQGDGACV